MNHFTTELVEALVNKQDVTEVFRSHLESAMNHLLETELTSFLDYEKYDRAGIHSGNSRNGSYTRTLHTEYGNLQLTMPRDRNGEFKQQTVAPYKRSNDTLESFVIHMFQKGVTMTEIADLIEKMYGHHYTPQTVSNMTKVMVEHVDAFMKRPLSKRYVCVYMDATYVPVKRETVSKAAVYVAVGIREDGSKEVITYCVTPHESAYMWNELLQDMKKRGTEEVLLFISDGLTGMVNAIEQVYPKAKYQACLVHVARNLAHKVRVTDRANLCEDFKAVYRAEHEAGGRAALEAFSTKWKTSYPKVVKSLQENPNLFTFYGFPPSIWRSIYSTNLIESFNKQIKKYTKRKEQFPHEEALEKFLVTQFENYNQRFATRCHLGFDQARAELAAMFNTTT
ncbi:transposase-like protein [Paenibacillus turicensis]|uniref:Mutator family transposase n=1 Tax=Paenibacillus turicensis TaxID=160487 RepID=A0ABS4FQC2_9BACL|nr:IS256 family transposase [Paenibacillus turicensis]MBP1904777.1 transposase-like protein [Paenibacillus turicensis]